MDFRRTVARPMNRSAPRSVRAGWVGWLAPFLIGLAVATPALAAPPLDVTKTVTHVNDQAPAPGAVVAVSSGDTVGYAIAVSGNPSFGGTDVTVTDVFDATALIFETSSTGACTAQAGSVTCTVRLADSGDAEVALTFRVLDVGDCQQLVNRVDVLGDREATGSAEATIEACPLPGGVLSGTPAANTAVDPSAGTTNILLQVVGGAALLAAAVVFRRRARHAWAEPKEA